MTQTTTTTCTEAACGSVLNRHGFCEDHWRLAAQAEVETGEYDGRPTYTVWITYPHAGVDRPRTQGIGCTKANLPRLQAAVNAGAAVQNPHVLTDVNGRTYVNGTCQISTRYVNVDLKRLGF